MLHYLLCVDVEVSDGHTAQPSPQTEAVCENLRKEEIINCVCGYMEEDGLMIQVKIIMEIPPVYLFSEPLCRVSIVWTFFYGVGGYTTTLTLTSGARVISNRDCLLILLFQCDLCLCWQHGMCNNIDKEADVPEKYVCYTCLHPMRQRASLAHSYNQDWLKEGRLPR